MKVNLFQLFVCFFTFELQKAFHKVVFYKAFEALSGSGSALKKQLDPDPDPHCETQLDPDPVHYVYPFQILTERVSILTVYMARQILLKHTQNRRVPVPDPVPVPVPDPVPVPVPVPNPVPVPDNFLI